MLESFLPAVIGGGAATSGNGGGVGFKDGGPTVLAAGTGNVEFAGADKGGKTGESSGSMMVELCGGVEGPGRYAHRRSSAKTIATKAATETTQGR